MNTLASIAIFLGLILMCTHARAQVAGCAPGDIPMTAGGVSTCLPGNAQPEQPQAPAPKWETRWGAIATDADKGVIGSVSGASSKADAKRAAMDDCRTKGGDHCLLQMPFSNGCAAVVVGDSVFNVAADETVDRASQAGIQQCGKSSKNCHVYFSLCSPPVRVL